MSDRPLLRVPEIIVGRQRLGFRVHVVPGARLTEAFDVRTGALWVRVAAAPRKGAANRALIEYLADRLRVARSAMTIGRGEQSRDKLVMVESLSKEELAQRLDDWLSSGGLSLGIEN